MEVGRLNTMAVYEFFRPKGTKEAWAAQVWDIFITPKHAFILSLGARSKLQTKDRLHHLQLDRNCSFCGLTEETTQYLFFLYPVSKGCFGANPWLFGYKV